MSRNSKYEKMPIVNSGAAGIDVGSKFHVVSVGSGDGETRNFGVYTADCHEIANWLLEKEVTTVALESTGSYWQGLFSILQQYELHPVLVSGKYTKNVKGKKTDILDAQWICQLHSLGLLEGSFLPDQYTDELKQYVRHRQKLQDNSNDYVRKAQKAMRQMNIRLDNVLSDIMGQSGRKIIDAILAGERDGTVLSQLANYRVKKSREEIAAALTGDWRDSYLFELKQSYDLYKYFHEQIKICDAQIDGLLKKMTDNLPPDQRGRMNGLVIDQPKKKNKNAPDFEIEKYSYGLLGVDLTQIEGVSKVTLLTLISEVGPNFEQFSSAGQFTSWLGLAPNNKMSGGKVISKRTSRRSSKVSDALKRVANVIGNLKSGTLNQFFKRMNYRKGRVFAITATARKVAVIIWNMITKQEPYIYVEQNLYQEQVRLSKIRSMRRQMSRFQIDPAELMAS